MPVALPPPVTPEPVPIEQVQSSDKAIRYEFGAHTLYLLAFNGVDRDALDRLVRHAPSAEQVVLGLSRLAYFSGGMTSQVVYAVDGQRVYAMMVQRRVRRVRGDPAVARFFTDAIDDGRLESNSFERGRVLASAYSERARLDVRPRFVDAPGGDLDLDLRARPDADGSVLSASMEFNNHGSRFAGRNLVALGVTGNSSGGTQGRLQVKTAPSAVNDEAERLGDYLEGELQLNTVGPAGVVGLTARRLDFSAEAGSDVLRGWYQEYGLEWSDVLGASTSSRSMLRLRGAWSDRTSERGSDGLNLFTERYLLASLTPSYAVSLGFGRFDAALDIIGAWANEQYASVAAERFQVVRPMLRLRWQQSETTSLTLTGAGQWSSDIVTESQQWTLGGYGSLSAYVPAALVGDSGALARLGQGGEWKQRNGWSWSAELFGEYGTTQRAADDSPRIAAGSAGLTLGMGWRRTLRVELSAARPVDAPPLADDAFANFYGSIKLTF